MSVKREVIEGFVRAGRAGDLRSLAGGISRYSGRTLRKTFDRASMTQNDNYLWILAMRYLCDLAKHGPEKCHANEREGFEEWIDAGAPLLFEDEVEAYLADNPLEE